MPVSTNMSHPHTLCHLVIFLLCNHMRLWENFLQLLPPCLWSCLFVLDTLCLSLCLHQIYLNLLSQHIPLHICLNILPLCKCRFLILFFHMVCCIFSITGLFLFRETSFQQVLLSSSCRKQTPANRTSNNTQKSYIVVPYYSGLSESIKNIGRKFGVQVHCKGGTTIKNLLMAAKDRDPIQKQSGVIYRYH